MVPECFSITICFLFVFLNHAVRWGGVRNGADEEKATTHPAGGEVTCFIDACLFRCWESKRSRICSTATQASSWPPSSPPSSARESFPWLFVVTAIVLCFLLEAVIVALVHVLLGVLLCAIWPSSTAAAIASRILRPAATIDRNPATPSATEEPPRDVRVGDCVVRRGELCTVIAIDRSVVPIGVTVQNQIPCLRVSVHRVEQRLLRARV